MLMYHDIDVRRILSATYVVAGDWTRRDLFAGRFWKGRSARHRVRS